MGYVYRESICDQTNSWQQGLPSCINGEEQPQSSIASAPYNRQRKRKKWNIKKSIATSSTLHNSPLQARSHGLGSFSGQSHQWKKPQHSPKHIGKTFSIPPPSPRNNKKLYSHVCDCMAELRWARRDSNTIRGMEWIHLQSQSLSPRHRKKWERE